MIAQLCNEKLGLPGSPLLMQIARQIGSCCGLLVLPLNESGVDRRKKVYILKFSSECCG
jgi:hypothetical protein